MIRLVFKNLWVKKKRNGWLLAELVIVSIILLHFVDPLTVQTYVNHLPDGYEKENLYRVSFYSYPSSSSLYNKEYDDIEKQRSCKWRFLEQVRHYPGVESATFQVGESAPGGTSFAVRAYCFKDSTMTSLFLMDYVPDSDFFKTFRFKAAGGPSIEGIDSLGFQMQGIMTEGALEDGPMLGRSYKGIFNQVKIIATVQPFKVRPEKAPQQAMFFMQTPENANIVFRLRDGIDEDSFLSEFIPWAQKTLRAGNFFVSNVTSYEDYVKFASIWMDYDYRVNVMLMSFFLFCLFFGVSGAFWMQTRSRREEVGIMRSFGATSGRVIRLFISEGIVLATLAVLAGSIIYLQYALHEGLFLPNADMCSPSVHYWYENFNIHFAVIMAIVWLLTVAVVSIGVSIPAWSISRMTPTDALHEE